MILAVRSLADLVQQFAVEQGLFPLTLRFGHVDHVPQQVEGQVDGQRRPVSATQEPLRRLLVLLGAGVSRRR